MLNLASLNNLPLILVCVVPGFIIMSIRSQFLTGRSQSDSRTFLVYVTVSFLYNSFVYPLVSYVLPKSQFGSVKICIWIILILFVPALLGLVFGLVAQKNWFYKVLRSCDLNVVHPLGTAWDWKFRNMTGGQWVIITLKDGTYFGGFCGGKSFISSEPRERDLYIQQIYDIDDDNKWELREGTSVLIAASQVSRVEFIYPSSRENAQ